MESLSLSAGTSGRAPGAVRADSDRDVREIDPHASETASFIELLNAMRVTDSTGFSGREGAAAAQAFEPGSTDARRPRHAALAEQYQTDARARQGPDPRDRTGIGARSDRASLTSDTRQTDTTNETVQGAPRVDPSPRTTSPSAGRADLGDRAQANPRGSPSADGSDRAQPARAAQRTSAPGRPEASATAPGTAGASIAPVARSQVNSGSVAHEVGKVLASGRVSGNMQGRAPAAQPSANPGLGSGQADGTRSKAELRGASERTETPRDAKEPAAPQRSDFDRLVRSLRLRLGASRSSARLHLDPPELGKVQVDVRMVGDELSIAVRAETDEARRLLLQRSGRLRDALSRQGIPVERFEVTMMGETEQPETRGVYDGFASTEKQASTDRRANPQHRQRVARAERTERMERGHDPVRNIAKNEVVAVLERRLDVKA